MPWYASTIAMQVGEQMRYRSARGAVSWLIGGTTRRRVTALPGVGGDPECASRYGHQIVGRFARGGNGNRR